MHLVQRFLSLRENKGFGSEACRAEDFRRRVSVVRRSAASDLVHESPQNLVPSFPLHQVFGSFRSSNPSDLVQRLPQNLVPSFPLHQVLGPFRSSNPLDLVQRLPQNLVPSFPLHQVFGPLRSSNPSDLVHESPQTLVLPFPLHQVFGPFRSFNPSDLVQRLPQNLVSSFPLDLVHESPQNLIPPFPLHQVFGFQFSVYDVTWCFTPRNPLFLRPEAPRPQVRMGLCRHGRGAPSPAIPCSFVRKHHVPRSGWAAALTDVVLHLPKSLIPSSRGTTSFALDGPTPALTWCFTPRNPLFLRRGAPRPRPRMGLEKEVRTNLPFDCTSFHFSSV